MVDLPFSRHARDFGLLPDGATNNSTALETALNSFPDQGGTLFFSEGQYNFANTVAWPLAAANECKPVALVGQGMFFYPGRGAGAGGFAGGATRFSFTGGNNVFIDCRRGSSTTKGQVGIVGISFHGGGSASGVALDFGQLSGATIENCLFSSWGVGVQADDSAGGTYYNNTAHLHFRICGIGFWSKNITNGGVLENFRASNCKTAAIQIGDTASSSSTGIVINGGHYEGTDEYAMKFYNCHGVQLFGTYFENNGDDIAGGSGGDIFARCNSGGAAGRPHILSIAGHYSRGRPAGKNQPFVTMDSGGSGDLHIDCRSFLWNDGYNTAGLNLFQLIANRAGLIVHNCSRRDTGTTPNLTNLSSGQLKFLDLIGVFNVNTP